MNQSKIHKKLTTIKINKLFLELCDKKDLIEITDILKNYKAQVDIDSAFNHLAIKGNIEVIEHLIQSCYKKKLSMSSNTIDMAFQYGHIQLVRFLLHNPMYDCDKDMVNIKRDNLLVASSRGHKEILEYAFTSKDFLSKTDPGQYYPYFNHACVGKNLNVVKFFLTCPTLKKKMPIKDANEGFKQLCILGHDEIIEYLLTSPELEEHIDINYNKGEFLNTALLSNNLKLAEDIIIKYNIKYTPEIAYKMNKYPMIRRIFEKRELNKELSKDLSENIEIIPKHTVIKI